MADLVGLLIDKYPVFDPAWPAETANRWFDGFARMMNLVVQARPNPCPCDLGGYRDTLREAGWWRGLRRGKPQQIDAWPW